MTLQQVIDTLNKAEWKQEQVQCINLYAGGSEDIEIIYQAPKESLQVNETLESKSEVKEEPKTESKEVNSEESSNKGENK